MIDIGERWYSLYSELPGTDFFLVTCVSWYLVSSLCHDRCRVLLCVENHR